MKKCLCFVSACIGHVVWTLMQAKPELPGRLCGKELCLIGPYLIDLSIVSASYITWLWTADNGRWKTRSHVLGIIIIAPNAYRNKFLIASTPRSDTCPVQLRAFPSSSILFCWRFKATRDVTWQVVLAGRELRKRNQTVNTDLIRSQYPCL